MFSLTRRLALLCAALAAGVLAGACAHPGASAQAARPPIVFVHGNGDNAAL